MTRKCFAVEVVDDGRLFMTQMAEQGEHNASDHDNVVFIDHEGPKGTESWEPWKEYTDLEEMLKKLKDKLTI